MIGRHAVFVSETCVLRVAAVTGRHARNHREALATTVSCSVKVTTTLAVIELYQISHPYIIYAGMKVNGEM